MELRHLRPVIVPLAGAILLGGCATYGARPPAIVYVPAPCGAPGAVQVLPVAPPAAPVATGPVAKSPVAGGPAVAPSPATGTADGSPPPDDGRCLVAVAAGRGGYYGPGYPYRSGYYGAPFYGSLGFGLGIGGHYGAIHGGGHHGGGHH